MKINFKMLRCFQRIFILSILLIVSECLEDEFYHRKLYVNEENQLRNNNGKTMILTAPDDVDGNYRSKRNAETETNLNNGKIDVKVRN